MNRKIIVGIVFLFFISVFLYLINGNFGRRSEFTLSDERRTLMRVFEKKGSAAAMEYFRATYKDSDPATLHELEHIFGIELYRKEGIGGVIFCDEGSFFGCYHGFFTALIAKEGKSVIPTIETLCRKQETELSRNGCIHGTGHGLLVSEGYQPDGLQGALTDCTILSEVKLRRGCYQGVFMEYNTQTMSGSQHSVSTRTFSKDNPYDPCTIVDKQYQAACFFELAGWWNIALSGDTGAMGLLCEKVKDMGMRDECFSGIGQMIVGITRFNRDESKTLCMAMPTPGASFSCMISAVKQFMYANRILDAKVLCEKLSESERDVCNGLIQSYETTSSF